MLCHTSETSGSHMVPNGEPRDGFFYPCLTLKENGRKIKYSFILIAKLHVRIYLVKVMILDRVPFLLCYHIIIKLCSNG